MALFALAVVVRAEVIVVAPALLLAAWWSGPRRRLAVGALVAALAASALAHVVLVRAWAGAVEPAGAAGAGGVRHYAAMIAALYRETFSLRALPRTGVWFALGVGPLALFAIARALRGTPGSHPERTRLAWVALAWSVPPVAFWLPQPVPILRHYLVALPGLCTLAALAPLPGAAATRRMVAAAVIVLDVLAPEALWRTWNATHPEAPKWPHGAVVYDRARTLERIAPRRALADSLAAIVRSGDRRPVVAVVGWEGYAYARLALALASPGPAAGTRRTLRPGVFVVDVPTGAAPVTLIFHAWPVRSHETRRAIEREVERRVDEGARLLEAP